MDDVLETIGKMKAKEAAEVLGLPEDTYANMNTSERNDCIYDVFKCSPKAKADLLGLPSEVNIPDDTEEIADFLSDKFEFCVISFEIEPDFNKVYVVEGAEDTDMANITFAVCSTKDISELAK